VDLQKTRRERSAQGGSKRERTTGILEEWVREKAW
jgi:hypothetical protein